LDVLVGFKFGRRGLDNQAVRRQTLGPPTGWFDPERRCHHAAERCPGQADGGRRGDGLKDNASRLFQEVAVFKLP